MAFADGGELADWRLDATPVQGARIRALVLENQTIKLRIQARGMRVVVQ